MKRTILQNNKGMSFVEVLLSVGILLGGMVASSALFYSQKTTQKNISSKLVLTSLREKIVEIVTSDSAWLGVQNDPLNSSMMCLQDPTTYTNCPTQETLVSVVKPELGINYRPSTNLKHGIDSYGNFCNTYPDENCPWRMTLTWKPACLSACTGGPVIQITAKFEPSEQSQISNFDMVLFRTRATASSTTYTNLSFERTLYSMFEDEVTIKGYKVIASPVSSDPINFSVCLENASATSNIFWPAVSGIDTDLFQCYPYTMPAGQSELFIPSHVNDSPTVPTSSPKWQLGYNLEISLSTIDPKATATGANRARIYVMDKNNRVILTSVKILASGDVVISGSFKRSPVPGSLHSAQEIPICGGVQIRTGSFTHTCPASSLTLPVQPGNIVHLMAWPDGIVPNSNDVVVSGP